MSCFIVERDTLNRAMHLLHDSQQSCEYYDKLGQDIWRLNRDAFAARYSSSDALEQLPDSEIESFRFYYSPRLSEQPMLAPYKSMGCLLYQCFESDIPDRTLFKRLKHAHDRAAHQIIDCLPEYDSLPWG